MSQYLYQNWLEWVFDWVDTQALASLFFSIQFKQRFTWLGDKQPDNKTVFFIHFILVLNQYNIKWIVWCWRIFFHSRLFSLWQCLYVCVCVFVHNLKFPDWALLKMWPTSLYLVIWRLCSILSSFFFNDRFHFNLHFLASPACMYKIMQSTNSRLKINK